MIQIEVGAMMVGGVSFAEETDSFCKGEEMGYFELAGSTIVILLGAEVRERLNIYAPFRMAMGGEAEIPVSMGEGIGRMKEEIGRMQEEIV